MWLTWQKCIRTEDISGQSGANNSCAVFVPKGTTLFPIQGSGTVSEDGGMLGNCLLTVSQ